MIRFRPLPGLTLAVLAAFAGLVGLGVWQLQRLEEKQALIATVAARMNAPPSPLSEVLALPPAEAAWRRVLARGEFLHEKEVYLFGARGPGGQVGLHVVTPLAAEAGTVLIDRGFVPSDLRDPAARADGQIAGPVAITGVVRPSQPPGPYTPEPDLAQRIWYGRDVPAMAEAMGLALAAPLVIEADAEPNPGGFPVGGRTVAEFPNNHLQYALTWFALALALLAVYVIYHHRQGRLTLG